MIIGIWSLLIMSVNQSGLIRDSGMNRFGYIPFVLTDPLS